MESFPSKGETNKRANKLCFMDALTGSKCSIWLPFSIYMR